jgi:plastocyanin
MPSWSIKINANPPGTNPPASFSPQTLQALKGDLISWGNNDNANQHWPAPIQNGVINKTGWLSEAIPPNASSKQSLSPSATGPLNYCCALHPSETGIIWVVGQLANELVSINTNPNPQPNTPAIFSPSPVQASVGDTVIWGNNDTNQHQPMPAGGSPTAWFSTPIAAGQSASTSVPTSSAGTINYGCALHSGEKGVITVT